MAQLKGFVHEPGALDPLVKNAPLHHQFETSHPCYDDNGRSGRIPNILSLVQGGLFWSRISTSRAQLPLAVSMPYPNAACWPNID
ncbi:MAG: hypothetical protein GWP70_06965 [Proteobacteria bacterium]|nr:hypothetical protein [Pseudomonadota bacterium]